MDLPPQVYCPLCGRPCQIGEVGTAAVTACSEGHRVKIAELDAVPSSGPSLGGLRTVPNGGLASWRDRQPML